VVDSTKPHGIKCGTFGASSIEERHLATGDHAGKLAIYDLDRVDAPVFSQQVVFV
jgi:WD repeat-containing protein 92